MANQHILKRLEGIHTILRGIHQASVPMSSASKGEEREVFVNRFLANVLPTSYCFGTGDVTGPCGSKSGQLDVVVEYPLLPSLPAPMSDTRLYLAEGVAAVVEVKSNLYSQFPEAVATSNKLASVKRFSGGGFMATIGPAPLKRIPMFVVGYKGWSKIETVQKHLDESPNIDGILVIDSGLFIASKEFRSLKGQGTIALWGLICCLHQATQCLVHSSASPIDYAT